MATKKGAPSTAPKREGVFNLLMQESPRGTALVAGEVLSELLGSLIERRCVDGTAKRLLDVERPLGAFSARITATFAFGLISVAERDDLDAIRRIRNSAAHFGKDGDNRFSFPAEACRTLQSRVPRYLEQVAEDGVRGLFIAHVLALHLALGARLDAMPRLLSPT